MSRVHDQETNPTIFSKKNESHMWKKRFPYTRNYMNDSPINKEEKLVYVYIGNKNESHINEKKVSH